MRKVITIIGPESTGKSVLTKELSSNYDGIYVPEIARSYLENLRRKYTYKDVEEMARIQLHRQKEAVDHNSNKLIFCDTNLEVYKVWFEHSFGHCPEWILRELSTETTDIYLLCNIDLPWESDPLREHPNDWQRQYFYNIYKDIVINSRKPFGVVEGEGFQRLQKAKNILSLILG